MIREWRAATARDLPWWLTAGTEQCEFCLRWYRLEAAYYCVDCDRPVCPVCVTTVRASGAVRCPGCRPPEGED
jgi:DNA-directed RNA polymerase subunit RPC12/RpoP